MEISNEIVAERHSKKSVIGAKLILSFYQETKKTHSQYGFF